MSIALRPETMRFLLAANSYPPILGGLQTVAHVLAKRFIQLGHEVQVVANRYPRALASQETLDGVPVRRWLFLHPRVEDLIRGRPDLFFASIYYYPTIFAKYARMFHDLRPEVINVHFPEAQIPFILRMRSRYSFRLVVSLHGDEAERYFDEKGQFDLEREQRDQLSKLRRILSAADAVTACSRYLLERAIELVPCVEEKGRVIHNGIDLARFSDKSSYDHPRPYILAYGRLTRKKGFDMLLEAYARIVGSNPDVDLIIAGDGEERQRLEGQIRRLGLESKAQLFGRATPTEVVSMLNGSLFVVVPSQKEPFGIVALEAMAAGKAVIACRVGGLPEILNEACNLLVEPSVEGLRIGISNWLADMPGVKKVERANQEVSAKYTWDRTVEKYLGTYMVPEPRTRSSSPSL